MTEIFIRSAYPAPVDHEVVKDDWAGEGFSFGVFFDPPGQEWIDFVHQTDEYVLVAQGELEVGVGGESAIVSPGDLIKIPRGVRHSLKTLSAEGSVWLYGYGYWGARHD